MLADMVHPNLNGRFARCAYCGVKEPSAASLTFFEYRGDGSPRSISTCKGCGYFEVAHKPGGNSAVKGYVNTRICADFEPRGAYACDVYYCGCLGWD